MINTSNKPPKIKRVFISYKSQYRDFALQVRERILSWGIEVWLDTINIRNGAYFRHEIQKGLEQSDAVIGILTAEAFQSREVMWEWDFALYNSHFIPVRYQDVSLPYHIQGTQYIDFVMDRERGFAELKEAIMQPHQDNPTIVLSSPQNIEPELPVQRDNRAIMLDKVHQAWISGVLDKISQHRAIEINIALSPTMVLQHRDYGEYKFDENTNIYHVFEDMKRELLILGLPGSGKTIMLLQLAQYLLLQAQQDIKLPIPVVLNLSSWSRQHSFDKWLIAEISSQYNMPHKVVRDWVDNEKLVLLLDGLDEIQEDDRNAAIKSINTYRDDYRFTDIVVTSRLQDYETLTQQLNLSGAITIQPLSTENIQRYLDGEQFTGLRAMLQSDATLQNLTQNPFFLNTMAIAYQNATEATLKLPDNEDVYSTRIHHLLDMFFEKQLRQTTPKFAPRKIRAYLAFLAASMHREQQSIFHIEDVQSTWLTSKQRRWFVGALVSIIIIYLILASLAVKIYFGQVFSLTNFKDVRIVLPGDFGETSYLDNFLQAQNLTRSILSPVEFLLGLALLLSLGGIIRLLFPHIQVQERFYWSRLGIGIGLVSGGVFGFTILRLYEFTLITNILLISSLAMILAISIGLLLGQFSIPKASANAHPNQGMVNALRHVLITLVVIVFLLSSLVLGLYSAIFDISNSIPGNISQFEVNTQGVFLSLVTTAILGYGLLFGGAELIKHTLVRLLLTINGVIPFNYTDFLNEASKLGIIRQVGSGFIFRHRKLLEHFAEQKKVELR